MRSKSPAHTVPQTLEEVELEVRQIAMLRQTLRQSELDEQQQIQRIRETEAGYRRPLAEELDQRERGVQVFADSHRMELTRANQIKSIRLPSGGELLWRMTPPRLVVSSRVKAATILATLKRRGHTQFIRIKEELDKEALKKHPEVIQTIRGLSLQQHEEFIIKT